MLKRNEKGGRESRQQKEEEARFRELMTDGFFFFFFLDPYGLASYSAGNINIFICVYIAVRGCMRTDGRAGRAVREQRSEGIKR